MLAVSAPALHGRSRSKIGTKCEAIRACAVSSIARLDGSNRSHLIAVSACDEVGRGSRCSSVNVVPEKVVGLVVLFLF